MTEEPGRVDTDDNDAGTAGPGSRPGTPRWVKVSGLIALALVVLFVVVQIVSGGDHGPGRHGGSSDAPPAGVTDDSGHVPPPGVDHGRQQP